MIYPEIKKSDVGSEIGYQSPFLHHSDNFLRFNVNHYFFTLEFDLKLLTYNSSIRFYPPFSEGPVLRVNVSGSPSSLSRYIFLTTSTSLLLTRYTNYPRFSTVRKPVQFLKRNRIPGTSRNTSHIVLVYKTFLVRPTSHSLIVRSSVLLESICLSLRYRFQVRSLLLSLSLLIFIYLNSL